MKKFTLSLLVTLLAGVQLVLAQDIRVTGKVTDNTGAALPGVSVVVQGTDRGVTTLTDGTYAISAPANATLQFSFVGMTSLNVSINNRNVVNAVMESDTQAIDEVIVVAYGTARKSTYTGSASNVNTVSQMKDLSLMSFENALQGSAPGVKVGVPNGQPGAQAEIRIRGTGSYNASNSPLYVIDGVPVVSGDFALAGYGGSMGIMSTINPSDIESMTILKDAAATSLYGSRGANGVIMVTTKKGRSGKIQVNFKGSWGVNDFAMDYRPILGGEESHHLAYEGAYNQNIFNGMAEAAAVADAQKKADTYYPLRDSYSDWEGALTRKAINSSYDVSLSGGNEKTTFYTSLGYRQEDGVFRGSDMGGFNGKASISHRDNNWTLNVESLMSKLKQNIVSGQDSGGNIAFANPYYAMKTYLKPNIPIYNEDGSFYTGNMFSGNYYNLVAELGRELSYNEVYRSKNSVTVGYEFIEGLSLRETLSYDVNDISGVTIWPYDSKNGKDHNGLTQRSNYKSQKFYSSLVLNYETTIRDGHNITALAGWDVDKTKNNYLYGAGKGFATTQLWEMNNAATPLDVGSYYQDDRIMSFFGSANYSYNNLYFLSGTFRRDGSSRLGANVRWGNFWSISGSWRMKGEKFLQDVKWVDNLRLRASFGTSGTLPSGLYSSLATFSYAGAYNGAGAASPARAANPDLSWEKNEVLDIAVEARLFDRFNLEVDFYDRQTNGMLLDVPLSLVTGFSQTIMNVGGMNNRGVEITLGADIFKGEFRWNSQLIASYNRNKVTDLVNGEEFAFSVIGATYRAREGHSLYSYYMRDFAGVDPGTGQSMWYIWEQDEKGKYTGNKFVTKDPAAATREIVAHADPDWTGGWRNTLSWKGIDLDLLFTYSLGGTSFDGGWAMTGDGTVSPGVNAISKLQLDRWQNPGDQAKFPQRMWGGGHGNYTSTRWLHSTDHIRLKSLTLGYTLPKKITDKAQMRNVRIFAAGTNLFTWAAYDDYDPEVPTHGYTGWAIPAMKSVTFGIEIGF